MGFLFLAIFGSVSLMIVIKLIHTQKVNPSVAITVNYFVAGTLSLLLTKEQMSLPEIFAAPWFWWGVILGALFLLSFFIWAASTRYSGVTTTTIMSRAAVAISVTYAFIMLGEQPTFLKIAMLVMILVSLGFALYHKQEAKSQTQAKYAWILAIALPLLVFLCSGANDIVLQFIKRKLLVTSADNDFLRILLFYSSAVGGLLIYPLLNKGLYMPKAKDLMWGALLGISNWLCVYSIFESLTTVEGAVFFPIYHSMTIILVTLIGVVAFREKLSRTNYIGIVLALIAIAVLSVQ